MNISALKRQITQFSQLSDLPQCLRQIVIDNKKMQKQILIFQSELAQKDKVILQLKQQLDSTVVEQTQQKLAIMRTIQEQIQLKAKEARQKFYSKSLAMEGEIQGLRTTVEELKQELGRQNQKEDFYLQKIESLKAYIMDIVEEKDYLIKELGQIIHDQDKKINDCSFCSKSPKDLCKEYNETKKTKKKVPFIRKNQ